MVSKTSISTTSVAVLAFSIFAAQMYFPETGTKCALPAGKPPLESLPIPEVVFPKEDGVAGLERLELESLSEAPILLGITKSGGFTLADHNHGVVTKRLPSAPKRAPVTGGVSKIQVSHEKAYIGAADSTDSEELSKLVVQHLGVPGTRSLLPSSSTMTAAILMLLALVGAIVVYTDAQEMMNKEREDKEKAQSSEEHFADADADEMSNQEKEKAREDAQPSREHSDEKKLDSTKGQTVTNHSSKQIGLIPIVMVMVVVLCSMLSATGAADRIRTLEGDPEISDMVTYTQKAPAAQHEELLALSIASAKQKHFQLCGGQLAAVMTLFVALASAVFLADVQEQEKAEEEGLKTERFDTSLNEDLDDEDDSAKYEDEWVGQKEEERHKSAITSLPTWVPPLVVLNIAIQ